MIIESLDELGAAVAAWRKNKKHRTDRIPEALIARAQKVAAEYGAGKVSSRLKISVNRLAMAPALRPKGRRSTSVPAFTRFEIATPLHSAVPLVEVESRMGVKLRVFQVTKETAEILGLFCRRAGGEA